MYQMKKAAMALCLSLTCTSAFAQKNVSGSVLDANGEPIIGATINVDGKAGAITDLDGKFSLNGVKPSSKITVSYVGYKDQTLTIGNQGVISIKMQEDNQQLNEIVVVGYGTMKKKDLTGAVASVSQKDIQTVAAPNPLLAMQAKVPGVDLTQSDGQAGSGVNINIRGTRSIQAQGGPLILVDGVEYGSLDIPSTDIESIDILKDAASTAIYGSRGANGVIIVTTKRGQAGKTKVNFNAYISANSPTGITKPMYGNKEVQRLIDKKNYQNMLANGFTADQETTTAENVLDQTLDDGTKTLDIYKDGSYTDWLDMIIDSSVSQNYEISVSGGNDKTQYNASLADMIDKGLMKGDKYNRYSGRANVDHRINKYIKMGTSIQYTYKNHDRRNGGVFNQAQKMTTITHAYKEDGTINAQPNPWYAAHCSPLLDEGGNYQRNIEASRFFGSAYLDINPIKGLDIRSTFTLDRYTERDGLYQDFESQGRYQSPSTTYISNTRNTSTKYTWQNVATYNKKIEKHDLTFMLGHEMTNTVYEYASVYGDAGAQHFYANTFYDTSILPNPSGKTDYYKKSQVSFFGRVNYSYDSKYLLQATLRTDGASVLAKGHKWDAFPSVSAGWRISDEEFMKDSKSWLSDLKLRAAWGISGNAAITQYQTLQTVSSITTNSTNLAPMNIGNEDLCWEKTSTIDLGIDYSLLNSRIYGNIDYYYAKTRDLLLYATAPATAVYTKTISNLGKTRGNGLEISLGAVPVQTKDLRWDINASATFQHDYIEELNNGLTKIVEGTTAFWTDHAINNYYDYEVDGMWNVGEFDKYVADNYTSQGKTFTKPVSDYGTPGTPKVLDKNQDGKIDEEDKTLFNTNPTTLLGLNTTVTYKGLSLSIQTMARLGGHMSYAAYGLYTYDGSNWGDLDYWTLENTGANIPSPGADSKGAASTYKTAIQIQKSDFFKIKDITLAYALPKGLLKNTQFLSSAKVYCSMKNFFTFSKFGNYDLERGGAINFPMKKQVVVGLNVTF